MKRILCIGVGLFWMLAGHAADWTALRGADAAQAAAVLRSGVDLNLWDADGNPALLVAALHSQPSGLRALLDAGAQVNVTNRVGASALIYSVGHPEKVRLLLRRGANPNHHSTYGTTPLIAAAGATLGCSSATLLLAAGADVHATNSTGFDALGRAAYAGNTALVKLLLQHGAAPNTRPIFPTLDGDLAPEYAPLHNAAFRGDPEMVKALLKAGADLNAEEPFAGTALLNALYGNHPAAAKALIDAGIDLQKRSARGEVPAMVWAAYSDVGDTTVAQALLDHHVPAMAQDEKGETALTWAHKRGDNKLVTFLSAHGVVDPVEPKQIKIPSNPVPEYGTDAWRGAVRDSVQRSLDLLQSASTGFLDSKLALRDNCVSCHHQTLSEITFARARAAGFSLDTVALRRQLDAHLKSWVPSITNAYELDEPQPDAPINLGWGLYGLWSQGHPADTLTEAMVYYLAAIQEKNGSWRVDDCRPPLEDGTIEGTALALHALKLYPIAGREKEMSERIQRAGDWLAKAEAQTPNRVAFQLLGLAWCGSHREIQRRLADQMLQAQRTDGGWSQLPGLQSDAWATSQALVALSESGMVRADDPAFRRGAQFLLSTQFADGSWFVRSRTWPFQPYFHSGFPFGKDQWISSASTTLATLALLKALGPS